jgi:hypothetical protein
MGADRHGWTTNSPHPPGRWPACQEGARAIQPPRQHGNQAALPPRRGPDLTAAQAAQAGRRQIAELTGKQPEGITRVEPAEDGWAVRVEVVEYRRIPSSTDLLATYDTELDTSGELISYHRAQRYTRG